MPGGLASGVELVGNLAFVADSSLGVQVVDIANPAKPVRVGYYTTGGQALAVKVCGNVALIANYELGLAVCGIAGVSASPPVFVGQPTSQAVPTGATVCLSAEVAGNLPFTWQWQRNGLNLTAVPGLAGADSSTLWLTNVQPSQAGNYSLVAQNSYGTVASQAALLTVGGFSPLTLSAAITGVDPNPLQLSVFGLPGSGTLLIEQSSDLNSWVPVATNLVSGPSLQILLPVSSGRAASFYRGVLQLP
jgi:hypothetical protein